MALVKPGPGPGFTLAEVPIPSIGPTDVLIHVEKAGLCGTDYHIYAWDAWAQHRIKPPLVVGHEFMGTVAAIGDAVTSVRVGERVSAEGHIADLTCLLCRTGNAHICERVKIIGVDRDGAFAEYISIPEYNVWRLDPAIPDEYAAVFDPLGNAVHTVMAAGVSVKSVAITGVGSIGLMAIPVARAAGASFVYAIDVNPAKLELAQRLGADATFLSSRPDLVDEIKRRTRGDGVDVLLEMSGSGAAIDLGLQLVRNGGTAALLGIPSDSVNLNLAERIIFKGLTVLGINGRRMFETWYQTEALVKSGRVDLRSIITHVLPYRRVRPRIRSDAQGRSRQDRFGFQRSRHDIMNQAFEAKLQTDLDALKKAGTYKHLRHLTTPMAAEVHMEEAGRRHRALEQQLLGARRSGRSRRCGKARARSVRRGYRIGALHLWNVLHPPRAGGADRGVFGHAGRALVRLLLEREHRALRDDLRRGLGDRLRRAQPRLDHRRRPAGLKSEAGAFQA